MNQKHDWYKLKIKFITGNYRNLKEFVEKCNLPYTSGNFSRNTKGWLIEKAVVAARSRHCCLDTRSWNMREKCNFSAYSKPKNSGSQGNYSWHYQRFYK
jgi:hypothetical protein